MVRAEAPLRAPRARNRLAGFVSASQALQLPELRVLREGAEGHIACDYQARNPVEEAELEEVALEKAEKRVEEKTEEKKTEEKKAEEKKAEEKTEKKKAELPEESDA